LISWDIYDHLGDDVFFLFGSIQTMEQQYCPHQTNIAKLQTIPTVCAMYDDQYHPHDQQPTIQSPRHAISVMILDIDTSFCYRQTS